MQALWADFIVSLRYRISDRLPELMGSLSFTAYLALAESSIFQSSSSSDLSGCYLSNSIHYCFVMPHTDEARTAGKVESSALIRAISQSTSMTLIVEGLLIYCSS